MAWPILKKYGYPVTMFIYTEGIRPGHFSGGESMSWEQLAEMRDAGVDIQAHSDALRICANRPTTRFTKKQLSREVNTSSGSKMKSPVRSKRSSRSSE